MKRSSAVDTKKKQKKKGKGVNEGGKLGKDKGGHLPGGMWQRATIGADRGGRAARD